MKCVCGHDGQRHAWRGSCTARGCDCAEFVGDHGCWKYQHRSSRKSVGRIVSSSELSKPLGSTKYFTEV